jgi:antitoxin component YwqK of YwqJK toxin-antitoxin module
MKKILSILLISMILFGCSDRKIEKRIMSELTLLNGLVYNEGELYTGEVWDKYNVKIWDKMNPSIWPDFDGLRNLTIPIGYNGYYKEGKRHGDWEYYYPNVRKAFVEFADSIQIQSTRPIKSAGFVRYKETYKNGLIVEVLVFNHLEEKVRKEKYENGKRHGIWEYYISIDEKDRLEVNYKNGELVVWEGLLGTPEEGKPDIGLDEYIENRELYYDRLPTINQDIKLFINGKEKSRLEYFFEGESITFDSFDQNIIILESESIL